MKVPRFNNLPYHKPKDKKKTLARWYVLFDNLVVKGFSSRYLAYQYMYRSNWKNYRDRMQIVSYVD